MSKIKIPQGVLLALIMGLAVSAGCLYGESPGNDKSDSAAAISDDELSYRHEPLLADSKTPKVEFTAGDPGENTLIARAFENAPPMIPHSLEDLLPISKDENACLECHSPENAVDTEATPTPASHLYDMRRGKQLAEVNSANFNCTQCHVRQADTGELVENNFEPYFRNEQSKKQSNLLDTLNEGVN